MCIISGFEISLWFESLGEVVGIWIRGSGVWLSYVEFEVWLVCGGMMDEGFHVFDEAGLEPGDVCEAEDTD